MEQIKKTLYIDMDNVIVDFPSGIAKLSEETQKITKETWTKYPVFSL